MNRKRIAKQYHSRSITAQTPYYKTEGDYLAHCLQLAQQKAKLFPVGQKVRKLSGGWKWAGAIATVTAHKQERYGIKLHLKFEDSEIEQLHNCPFPWGEQTWDMDDFEPVSKNNAQL